VAPANAFNRREQLTLINANTVHSPIEEWGEVMSAQGGLYAPTIRYHQGTFYVVCTNVIRANDENSTESRTNFIISTTDIYSDNWSDPIFFEFDGIDTSLVWDDEGKAYLREFLTSPTR
jgi:beta-xylosidase